MRLALAMGLLRLPDVAGYGWAGAWLWLPDLTLVIGILAVLLAATALLLALASWRGRRGSSAGVASAANRSS